MISALRLERFKRYLDQRIELTPLTLLTGSNGAGKSSVLQSLLLLRQVGRGANAVALNGPYGLALGEATDVLNHEADGGEICLTVEDTVTGPSRAVLQVPGGRSQLLHLHQRVDLPSVLRGPERHFGYVTADRLGPRDAFEAPSLDAADLSVGARGEAVAHVLAQLESALVEPQLVQPSTESSGARQTIPAQTELWMSTIVAPMQIEALWVPNTSVTTLRFRKPHDFSNDWMRPGNAGFGRSYTLPVVVAALAVGRGGLLMVENPEAHLHPRGQSAIGAFLASVAASGAQVIVETHSDHVINGVRRAVAINRTLEPSQVSVLFFDDANNGQPEKIQVRSNGELSAWPAKFFDQLDGDLAALAGVRRKRGT